MDFIKDKALKYGKDKADKLIDETLSTVPNTINNEINKVSLLMKTGLISIILLALTISGSIIFVIYKAFN